MPKWHEPDFDKGDPIEHIYEKIFPAYQISRLPQISMFGHQTIMALHWYSSC